MAAKIKNTFLKGTMNKDLDERLIPEGHHRDALNINTLDSGGSDSGALENMLGNEKVFDFDIDGCIVRGTLADDIKSKIYFFVDAPERQAVFEYDEVSDVVVRVLGCDPTVSEPIFGGSADDSIEAVKITHDNSDDDLLVWTDNNTEPKCVNIERAKGWANNGIDYSDITLIKRPPYQCPLFTGFETNDNPLTTKSEEFDRLFISFAYRYVYKDGQRSALSPFSLYLFNASTFKFDVSSYEDVGMTSNIISVNLKLDTGRESVIGLELAYKFPESNNVYKEEYIDVKDLNNNDEYIYTFRKPAGGSVLPNDEYFRYYDNVPKRAKTIEFIGNRIVFGNYTDGFDLTIDDGSQYVERGIPTTSAYDIDDPKPDQFRSPNYYESIKLGLSYEVFRVFFDSEGRLSQPLKAGNLDFTDVPEFYRYRFNIGVIIEDLSYNNRVDFPNDAVGFRMYIKEPILDYQTVIINEAYRDGKYYYLRLSGQNVNKVQEGELLRLKEDLSGVSELEDVIKKEVLEVKNQQEDFIEGVTTPEGLYAKIDSKDISITDGLSEETYFGNGSDYTPTERARTSPAFNSVGIPAGSFISWGVRFRDTFTGSIVNSFLFETTSIADYVDVESWYNAEFPGYGDSSDFIDTDSFFQDSGEKYSLTSNSTPTVIKPIIEISITYSTNLTIFETEPDPNQSSELYECPGSVMFDTYNFIENNLNFFNCYKRLIPRGSSIGDWRVSGSEEYRYRGRFNSPKLEFNQRPITTIDTESSFIDRSSDLTYSEPYVESSGIKALNEFNLSKANFKDDLDKKYGGVQKILSRDTDLLIFQEDKVSKVMVSKSLLVNADGTANVSSVENVLGQQVSFVGEYGVSRNPESVVMRGRDVFFTDFKRGTPLMLGANGIHEINTGMNNYFRNSYKTNIDSKRTGVFDQYLDQYILIDENDSTLIYSPKSKGWISFASFSPRGIVALNNNLYSFDDKGSMFKHNSLVAPRCNFYDVQYPSNVEVMVNGEPSTIKVLKSIGLEGNSAMSTTINSYMNNDTSTGLSEIPEENYIQKEGIWYSNTMRSSISDDISSKNTYGIGVVESVVDDPQRGLMVYVIGGSISLGVSNSLYGEDGNFKGIISEIYNDGDKDPITGLDIVGLHVASNTAVVGDYLAGSKNPTIEGTECRGYTFKVGLESNSPDKVELFAINSEVFKSFS